MSPDGRRSEGNRPKGIIVQGAFRKKSPRAGTHGGRVLIPVAGGRFVSVSGCVCLRYCFKMVKPGEVFPFDARSEMTHSVEEMT